MLEAMRAFNRRNQPALCSLFVLGGANTPASVAPTVAQLPASPPRARTAPPASWTPFRGRYCAPRPPGGTAVAFSPDGAHLATVAGKMDW